MPVVLTPLPDSPSGARAQADLALINQRFLGRILTLVAATGALLIDGTNPNTVDPLLYALFTLGRTPASPYLVTDADLANLSQRQWTQLLDVAELRLLQNAVNGLLLCDKKVSLTSINSSQIRTGIDKRIAALEAKLQIEYGIGANRLHGGVVRIGHRNRNQPSSSASCAWDEL